MKIKTEDLEGIQLDVAVAIALGGEVTRPQDGQVYLNGMHQLCGEKNKRHSRYVFSPSTDWNQCGSLIEFFSLKLEPVGTQGWQASTKLDSPGWCARYDDWIGETALIAVCRAVVASKIGDEVDLADELAGKEPS